MRTPFATFVILSSVSSALSAWVPYSSVKHRRSSAFLDCLDNAELDPVVPGDADYDSDASAFNLRCVMLVASPADCALTSDL